MKKLLCLILISLLFLVSCNPEKNPENTLTDEEIEMIDIVIDQVSFALAWELVNLERPWHSSWSFRTMRANLNSIRDGIPIDHEHIMANSVVYRELMFVSSEEEANALTEIPEYTLVAWPSERTVEQLEWFNLVAIMPNRMLRVPQIEEEQTTDAFYNLFPEHGLEWPLTIESFVENAEEVARLWSRLATQEKGRVTSRNWGAPMPTEEEIRQQIEDGRWVWR